MSFLQALIVALITGAVGAVVGSGGVLAWFKLGPERKKINADTEKVNDEIRSNILKDLRENYIRVSDDNAQLAMELLASSKALDDCEEQLVGLQATLATLRVEMARHGRMAELSRAKAHLALNQLGKYEIHIANLLDKMRDHICVAGTIGITITPDMRPHRLRATFQAEMDKLEQLEIETVNIAMENEVPPK